MEINSTEIVKKENSPTKMASSSLATARDQHSLYLSVEDLS